MNEEEKDIKAATDAILTAEIAVNRITRHVKTYELDPFRKAIMQLKATREFVESFPTFIPSLQTRKKREEKML